MQAARRVEQENVGVLQFRAFERAARDIDRLLALDDRQSRDIDLRAEHLQLFLRRRTIDVERGHQCLLAMLFADKAAKLGGGRRLARALQADHHDDDRRLGLELQLARVGIGVITAAEHGGQLVIDDLDHLLAGGDGTQHVLADGAFGDGIDEAAHDGQSHVGFEQRDPHFAHRIAHVLFGQCAAPFQAIEDGAETVGQSVEHGLSTPCAPWAPDQTRKTPADENSSASVANSSEFGFVVWAKKARKPSNGGA